MDMFDLKPRAPSNVRGEMIGTPSSIPGLQICSLMPGIAGLMHEATLIRSYSHKYNSHNPYNVLTGFDGGNDAENYFAKRSDHPSMGSICQHLDIGPRDVPRYVLMPAFPGYGQSLRRAGPYGGYLGSRYDPLFTVCDPKWDRKGKGDYDPVLAHGAPLLPSLDELPSVTADRLDRRRSLLEQFDTRLRGIDKNGSVDGMTKFQQQVFGLLTSPKTRAAFDLSKEPQSVRDRYGDNLWGNSTLVARKLVEAGSTFVTVNWEAQRGGHWDLHGNTFGMLRAGQRPEVQRTARHDPGGADGRDGSDSADQRQGRSRSLAAMRVQPAVWRRHQAGLPGRPQRCPGRLPRRPSGLGRRHGGDDLPPAGGRFGDDRRRPQRPTCAYRSWRGTGIRGDCLRLPEIA